MHPPLFVYGTLMLCIQSRIAGYLHENSRFLGEATVPGLLYDLGRYPGLWHEPKSERLVYGHLLELIQPDETLLALDRYEGIGTAESEVTEYRRELVKAQINGQEVDCWCYVLTHIGDHFREISSGDYRQYLEGNSEHWGFIGRV